MEAIPTSSLDQLSLNTRKFEFEQNDICEWGIDSGGEDDDQSMNGREWWKRSAAAAKQLFGVPDNFLDGSRETMLDVIVPVLTLLSEGRLSGNHNCFLVLGTRGVGKTHFCRSLTYCNAVMSRKNVCSIYVNCKVQSSCSPFSVVHNALKNSDHALNLPSVPWTSSQGDHLLKLLIEKQIHVFLVLDEVEELYRGESTLDSLRQLHAIGNWSQSRPIVVLAIGSSAVLRTLFFAIPGHEEEMTKIGYKNYQKVASLNERKFRPLVLCPVISRSDVQSVSTDEEYGWYSWHP